MRTSDSPKAGFVGVFFKRAAGSSEAEALMGLTNEIHQCGTSATSSAQLKKCRGNLELHLFSSKVILQSVSRYVQPMLASSVPVSGDCDNYSRPRIPGGHSSGLTIEVKQQLLRRISNMMQKLQMTSGGTLTSVL